MLRRVILGLLAALVLLAGLAAGAAAGWAAAVLAPADGVLRYAIGTVTPGPGASALLIDVERFDASVPYIGWLGETTLAVESADGAGPLFLGAATTPTADAYLAGVPYSVGIRQGGQWEVRDVPGSGTPAPPAAAADWLASSEGDRPAIRVPVERPLTLVILHPDGSTLGPVQLGIDFTVVDVSRYVLWLAVAAVVLLLVGLLLVFLAIQRIRPGKHVAAPLARGRHARGRIHDHEEVRDEQPVG